MDLCSYQELITINAGSSEKPVNYFYEKCRLNMIKSYVVNYGSNLINNQLKPEPLPSSGVPPLPAPTGIPISNRLPCKFWNGFYCTIETFIDKTPEKLTLKETELKPYIPDFKPLNFF